MKRVIEVTLQLLHRMFNRTLHAYFFMHRGLTLGVRAIVRSNDGKFLLVRHTYTPGWHFPGGGVEKGQTTLKALQAELQQETNLQIVGTPVIHGIFYNYHISKRDHVLVYLCDVSEGSVINSSTMEIAEIGYFGLEDLPQDTDPGTLRRIYEIESEVERTEEW